MGLNPVLDFEDEAVFFYKWLFKRDKILIDNIVFYLHYHITLALFILGCLVVTTATFLLDPIECIADKIVDEVIDDYCLFHSTRSISIDGSDPLTAHPGVSPPSSRQNVRYHNYYLWVPVVLGLQGISFHIARGMWKWWDGSRVSMMLEEKNNFIASNDQDKRKHFLVEYILTGKHDSYCWKLLTCEIVNLLNAIFQLFIIQLFMGFKTLELKFNFMQLLKETYPQTRPNYFDHIFPKVTKCTFYSFGPSGTVVNFDAICVLPVNAVNEKLFAVISIWLLVLISVSAVAVAYRFLFIICAPVRSLMLKLHIQLDEIRPLSLKSLSGLNIGGWQLLCQLCGNSDMDSWELTEIVKYLCELSDNPRSQFQQ